MLPLHLKLIDGNGRVRGYPMVHTDLLTSGRRWMTPRHELKQTRAGLTSSFELNDDDADDGDHDGAALYISFLLTILLFALLHAGANAEGPRA